MRTKKQSAYADSQLANSNSGQQKAPFRMKLSNDIR